MPYPSPFLRLVVSGTLYNVEDFSYGMSFINDNGLGDPPSEVPAGVVSALATYHQAVSTAQAKLTMVKLNLIGTDGRYVSQSDTVLHEWTTPVVGTGTQSVPPQVSLAVTLRTGARRGLASRGRFYLPLPNVQVSPTDGILTPTTAGQVLTATNTLVSALETAIPGWDLGVVSNVREGAQRAVDHIEVGRVLDTIRSRRVKFREQYQIGPTIVEP